MKNLPHLGAIYRLKEKGQTTFKTSRAATKSGKSRGLNLQILIPQAVNHEGICRNEGRFRSIIKYKTRSDAMGKPPNNIKRAVPLPYAVHYVQIIVSQVENPVEILLGYITRSNQTRTREARATCHRNKEISLGKLLWPEQSLSSRVMCVRF